MTKTIKFFKCGAFVLLQAFALQTYAAGDKPYTIVDGKVDVNTFHGWQIYQEVNCGLCHGNSGQGDPPGNHATNLDERLKIISKEQFVNSTIKGKGLMPPFIANQKVVNNIDKIYAYLKARSDGALGEGKPEKQQ